MIEEMFSRLNEAAPLTAPEKRNAYGGPLPRLIRKLATKPFFTKNLPFRNKRYRHFDLATRFLLAEDKKGVVDAKKYSPSSQRDNDSATVVQVKVILATVKPLAAEHYRLTGVAGTGNQCVSPRLPNLRQQSAIATALNARGADCCVPSLPNTFVTMA